MKLALKHAPPKGFGKRAFHWLTAARLLTSYPHAGIVIDGQLMHINNLPLIAHEEVHLKEQARWLVVPWWIAYLLSPKFRLAAEVRAHRVQIDMGGCTPEQAARWLATNYRLRIDIPTALAALKREHN